MTTFDRAALIVGGLILAVVAVVTEARQRVRVPRPTRQEWWGR